MSVEYRLKGHEKFPLREGWIGKGLESLCKDPRLFSGKKAADELGVGSNMVKAIRYWLRVFGLITDHRGIALTELGKVILERDPDLEQMFTLWLLHMQIADCAQQATTWYLFFHHNRMSTFQKEDLFEVLKKELLAYAQIDSFTEGSLKDDIDVLLGMYGRSQKDDDPEDKVLSPFSRLGLLRKGEQGFEKQIPRLRDMDERLLLLKLYRLFEKQNGEGSVNMETITRWAEEVFYLPKLYVHQMLEKLEHRGLIALNRTAGLDTIYLPEPMDAGRLKEQELAMLREVYTSSCVYPRTSSSRNS